VDLLAAPPLGLCYVASATQAAGHDVKVIDLCFTGHSLRSEIEHAVRSFQPEVVGLSIRNIDNVNMLHPVSYMPGIREIARDIQKLTSVPIVLGGSAASLMPESILRLLVADYIIVSDGEQSFVELLASLEAGTCPDDIPGVGRLINNRFHLTPPRLVEFKGGTADLGRWIDIGPYQKIGSSYNIQTKRGCRQRCIYCTYNQSLEGNRLRLRSPKEVVDEVEEALFKYRPQTFEFVDAVFNDPPEHAAAIMEEIVRRPWKAEFTAMGVHPRKLDSEYLDLMWRAGFRSLMITPESVSDTMLQSYRKGFTRDEVIHAAEAINKTSFAAWWFFMIGGPGETNETLQESLDFALEHLQKNGRPVTNVAHFFIGVRIYPGTKLWDIALREGFVSPHADPLRLMWYLSRDLDLDRATQQMTAAAAQCPEIYLGFDERVLVFSKPAAMVFKALGLPRPYWRYFRAANQFGLRTGIRFMYRPPNIAGMLRDALNRQRFDDDEIGGTLIPHGGATR
jgi:radical SAM superfamily enzyme YgiQ (UPF0313 family)